MRNLPRCTGQLPEKNSDDLKDEITTDDVPTTDGQWMGYPNLRLHEESTKRAQRGQSIDSDISRFVEKMIK